MAELEGSNGSRRRRILDAAFEISQERGVHLARMEEVAARAQVSKGTLYRFFENKEDLFLEMMIDSYLIGRRASGAEEIAAAPTSPEKALRQRLEGLAHVLDVIAPRARVQYQAFGVVGDSPEASARLNQFLAEFHRDRQAEWAGLVREGQAKGAFREGIEPAIAAQMIGNLLSGFIYQASFDPENATPKALQACFDTILRDILGSRSDARPPNGEMDA